MVLEMTVKRGKCVVADIKRNIGDAPVAHMQKPARHSQAHNEKIAERRHSGDGRKFPAEMCKTHIAERSKAFDVYVIRIVLSYIFDCRIYFGQPITIVEEGLTVSIESSGTNEKDAEKVSDNLHISVRLGIALTDGLRM